MASSSGKFSSGYGRTLFRRYVTVVDLLDSSDAVCKPRTICYLNIQSGPCIHFQY